MILMLITVKNTVSCQQQTQKVILLLPLAKYFGLEIVWRFNVTISWIALYYIKIRLILT